MLLPPPKATVSPNTSVNELVEHFQQKDAAADASFRELYRRYYRSILGHIYFLIRDLEEAKNLCQEVFLTVITKLQTKDREAPFDRWIHRIAAHQALDYIRRKRLIDWQRLPEDESEEDGYSTLPPLASTDPSVEEQVIDLESVNQLLERLKPVVRYCLVLHVQWGFQQKEIADLLDISPKRVNDYIRRASRPLRQLYPHLQIAKVAKSGRKRGSDK